MPDDDTIPNGFAFSYLKRITTKSGIDGTESRSTRSKERKHFKRIRTKTMENRLRR